MGLDLNIIAGPGRRPMPIEYEIVRPMNEADIALLSQPAAIQANTELKRITDRHHALAKLLASGTPESEAALIVGYEPARVSTLKNSPAFQELLAFYQKEAKEKFDSVLDHMAGLSRDALLELRTRIEDQPERFSVLDLTRLITELHDRTAGQDDQQVDLPELIELVPKALDEKG